MEATDHKDLSVFLNYLERNSIEHSVDTNPSAEKISRIKRAIEMKADLIDATIKVIKNAIGSKDA